LGGVARDLFCRYGNTIDTIAGDKGVAVFTYKSHVQGMSEHSNTTI